ncbi:di-trans-poly-cis-decaprenylcistransferase [Mycobacteroides abscessus subsp. abscessus]|nr:di-trans-poly-cis-decaprenylcistransferase [Mycobacteroides abscessus subsp. abscessus]
MSLLILPCPQTGQQSRTTTGPLRRAHLTLTNAARTSGELRGDLTVDQILALVASVANIPGDPAYREPILNASLDGLRTLRSRE